MIKREFLTRVKTKGFIIGTLVAPVLMTCLVLLPGLFMRSGSEAQRKIAVVDLTGRLIVPLQNETSETRKNDQGKPLYTLIPIEADDAPLDTVKTRLNQRVRKGEINLFLVLPKDIFESNQFEMYSKNTGNFQLNESMNGMVSSVVSKIRLSESGLDPERVKKLNARVRAKTFTVGETGAKEESGELAFMLNYILVFFIYMALIYYGMFIIRGVIEDKNSRVMEVLLSSSRPHEIMAGKIFGNGLAGLVQIGVWGLCILLASTYGLAMVKTFSPAAKIPLPSVSVEIILAFVLFFLLGYFIYSSVYAAMGSIGNSDSEIQNLQWPAIAPIMVSFFLIFAINKNPDGTMATVLSLIPFFSPLLMFTRISAHAAPLGQVLICIGLCLLTIAALVWVAGRIFRVGILMHGKRPTLPEILKWIRYS
jgi:ABC-2 type transport system permease protein